MNFQTSKRIMCCLMAALILCCAVVQPIKVSASVIATGTIAAAWGVETIISAMIGLGVTYQSYEMVKEFARNLVAELPEDDKYIYPGYDEPAVKVAMVNGKSYVSQSFLEWLQSKLNAATSIYAPVYNYTYPGTPDIPGESITYEQAFARLCGADGVLYPSHAHKLSSINRCYTYTVAGPFNSGFYYWGDTRPTFETVENLLFNGTVYETSLRVKGNGNFILYAYDPNLGIWTTHTSVLFPGATSYERLFDSGRRNIVAVPGAYVKENFIPRIDTDKYQTWINTGIWIVITDDPATGDNGNDDNGEPKKPIPFIPLSVRLKPQELDPEYARSGDGSEFQSDGKGAVDVYDDSTGNDPDIDEPAVDPVDYDDTNLLEQLRLFGIDLKNGFNDMVNKLLSLVNVCSDILKSSNSILEAVKGLADLFIPKLITALGDMFTVYIELLVEKFGPLFNFILDGIPAILKQLAEWLKPLMDYLLDGLKNLFVPKTGYFDAKIMELRAEFKLFDSILATLYDLKGFLISLGSTPPVIYANLAAAGGSIYWGANTVFVDMRWYAPYKPIMDTILSGLLWLWFAWRMVLSIPGILGGMSGMWKNPTNYTKTTKEE